MPLFAYSFSKVIAIQSIVAYNLIKSLAFILSFAYNFS